MDRKARDLASGKKKLEEYKRKKMAKGAALRAQMEHGAISESAHEHGLEYVAPASPTKSDATSTDAARNKYTDRLEARLASVLGNKTNADARLDSVDQDGSAGRLDERREKAIVAGRQLSDELAAARADIAAARDLTANAAAAGAGDQTSGGYSTGGESYNGRSPMRSPMSTPGRERDVPRGAPAPADDNAVRELRERVHAEHTELSKVRGELSALRAEENSRYAETKAETNRLLAAEREARDLAETKAAEASSAATARDEAFDEALALKTQVAALETAKGDALAATAHVMETLAATQRELNVQRELVAAAEAGEFETKRRAAVELAETETRGLNLFYEQRINT